MRRLSAFAVVCILGCGKKTEGPPKDFEVTSLWRLLANVEIVAPTQVKISMIAEDGTYPERKAIEPGEFETRIVGDWTKTEVCTIKGTTPRFRSPKGYESLEMTQTVDCKWPEEPLTASFKYKYRNEELTSASQVGRPGWKEPAKPDARSADQPLTVADISPTLGDLQMQLKGYMKETDAPMDQRSPNDIGLFMVTVDRVAAIGPAAVPQLVDIWLTELQPIKIRAAAQAVAAIDPATFIKETVKALDAYDAAYLKDPASRMTGAAPAAAAGVHSAMYFRTGKVLTALLRALSSPDPAASGASAKWLKENLDAQKAIDSLFAYMAAKNKYSVREINVYVDVITQFRDTASPIVVKNLEALLAAAKSPNKVFWAHKVVAMTALQQVGKKDAAPTVKKFTNDSESYESMPIAKDPNNPIEGLADRKTITFKSLAEKTLAEVEKR